MANTPNSGIAMCHAQGKTAVYLSEDGRYTSSTTRPTSPLRKRRSARLIPTTTDAPREGVRATSRIASFSPRRRALSLTSSHCVTRARPSTRTPFGSCAPLRLAPPARDTGTTWRESATKSHQEVSNVHPTTLAVGDDRAEPIGGVGGCRHGVSGVTNGNRNRASLSRRYTYAGRDRPRSGHTDRA